MKVKLFSMFLLLMAVSCSPGGQDENVIFEDNPDCIYVIMFHLAQRCESCKAVETETRAILEKGYKDEMDAGEMRFLLFDILSDSGKKAARQLMASGQTLYIVKGDSISDLTGSAFLFAQTHPERYHKALKQELDKDLR